MGGAVATAVAPGESFLRFKSASIDAVYSALSSDSRFKVVTKRERDATVSLGDGEMILLGGLQQDKQMNKRVGLSFLPQVLDSTSGDDNNTEILVLLQVNKVR